MVGQLPVIILDGGEGPVWERDNFSLVHEVGHLVMHRASRRSRRRSRIGEKMISGRRER